MILNITCKYCDFKWQADVYSKSFLSQARCDRCGDKHLIIREQSQDKIDTYAGAPPFKKDDTEKHFTLDSYGNQYSID